MSKLQTTITYFIKMIMIQISTLSWKAKFKFLKKKIYKNIFQENTQPRKARKEFFKLFKLGTNLVQIL